MDILQNIKDVFLLEAKELKNLSNNIERDIENVVLSILNSKGKLIVSGMGKSGLIGKKIAATFASTGTPSFFLHPAEAYHGDLGMVEKDDILLLISNSGESDEVLRLLPFLKSQGNSTISMSGNPKSTLAKNTDYHLNIAIQQEACPLQLAPTTSTTATLVMGDALAVVLMKLRNFRENDFAKFHPGGSLGRRLLTNVESIMQKENLPICSKDTKVKELIHKIGSGKAGLVAVLDGEKIIGIITDGDIRRAMERSEEKFFSLRAENLMSVNPKTVKFDQKFIVANEIMNRYKINSLLVVDDRDRFIGIVQVYSFGS